MLPTSEPVNPDTMQTGELERAAPEEAPPHASMTVTGDSPQPKSLLPPPLIATITSNSADYKYKHDTEGAESPTPASSEVDGDQSDAESYADQRQIIHSKSYHQQQSLQPSNRFQPSAEDQQTNESVRSWLQRITAMQQEIQRKQKLSHSHGTNNQNQTNTFQFQQQSPQPNQQPASRVVKYEDLPFMGEMTLDNSKPRRGRKPKKADICHLIYKNYGTIFPGTPRNLVDTQQEIRKPQPKPLKDLQQISEPVQRTNVQNRIISSLLEKRLTQESLRQKELLQAKSAETLTVHKQSDNQDEPLNLCIRDLNQLKIRLLRKHGNVYESEIKSEPPSEDDDVEFVDETPSPDSVPRACGVSPAISELENVHERKTPNQDAIGSGGYVYWPNAGVFIHPMALQSQLMYYQRLAQGNNYTIPGENIPTTPPSVEAASTTSTTREFRKLVPKHLARSASQNQDKQSSPVSLEDSNDLVVTSGTTTPSESRIKRVASQPSSAPTKRKRSAIFIPPIPTENQTNPATEVSICKFKFTGGAKPSLQEKKMLSVDSGGNFRYYSGTGDKSMRGYEFFPRETLQQQAAAGTSSHGSGTGAFLQASGEKIPIAPSPDNQKQLSADFMFAADAQSQGPMSPEQLNSPTQRHRKRKTRKSLQREKLEQTFKEKGFLIQTQQLESAEGATYCKFRQLRKFTRYLFRSWKDYLPGNVRELQEGERSDDEDTGEGLRNASPPSGAVLVPSEDGAELSNA